jgi:hypothetical protein
MVKLVFEEFDGDLNTDTLCQIDYSNIYGEIVTLPALLNRVSVLKAEVENRFATEKVELDIYEAQLRKQFRSKSTTDGKKPTVQEVEDELTMDLGWQNKKKKLIRYQKDVDYVMAFFFALRSKDEKLNNIKSNVTPLDFEKEIVSGIINTIMIKVFDKKMARKI